MWLWDSAPMRAVLARVDVAAMVALVRVAAGLSQEELGHLITGWSQSTVSQIERRRRHSLHDIRRLLAFADQIGMPRTALAPLILGHPDAVLECDAVQGGEDVDLDRRGFHALTAGLAAAALLPVPDLVERAHVRYLQAALSRLRAQDHTVGGAGILRQALALFGRARTMLDDCDYTAEVGRELLVVTADLGIVTAWLAYDAGDQHRARRLYHEAAMLAGSANDDELLVHVYANMAQQSTFLARQSGRRGAAREALRFADQAADHARHIPSAALHALVALRQALAHAQMGDQVAFRGAISTARRQLDRDAGDQTRSWTAFVTHSEITGYEAMGRAQLGQPEQAGPLFRLVLNDRGRSPRDHAYYRARLAEAMCAAGDHKAAVHEGMQLLPRLGRELASVRVLNELRPVRKAAETLTDEEFCVRFDTASRVLIAAS